MYLRHENSRVPRGQLSNASQNRQEFLYPGSLQIEHDETDSTGGFGRNKASEPP